MGLYLQGDDAINVEACDSHTGNSCPKKCINAHCPALMHGFSRIFNADRASFYSLESILLLLIIIRPRRSGNTAAYSRQTFPRTFCRSVRASVCPVHCGKMADRIQMPFGIVGRTGPGMRQVLGFGNRSTERDTFGAHLGRAIVTNGDFTAYVCKSAATRPSSQITLSRLLLLLLLLLLILLPPSLSVALIIQ